MNDKCRQCQYARNCINGIYCTELGKYVQYGHTECKKNKDR